MVFTTILQRGRTPVLVDEAAALQALSPFRTPDNSGIAQVGRCQAIQVVNFSTAEARVEDVPYVDPRTGCLIASWMRLDNRKDLGAAFNWKPHRTISATDPEFLAEAWDRWGPDCADRLEGDFAFVIWDPRNSQIYAARDAAGIKPLYYAKAEDAFVVSTTAATFRRVPGVDVSPSQEWMGLFLEGQSMDWETTALTGVRKLPPAHYLQASDTGVQTRRYHSFRDDSPWETVRDPIWLERYRSELFRAVGDRMRTDSPIGVESSGGLDSSSILGLVAHLDPSSAGTMHTFGFATEPLEPEYMLETSRVHRITNNHVFTRYGVEDETERGWKAIGYPAEHSNATGHIPFYELALTLNVGTLHSGHGGDEAVTQSAGIATQEFIARRNYALALHVLPGRPFLRPARLTKRLWVARKTTNVPMTRAMVDRLDWTVLTDDALAELHVEQRVRKAARFDAPYRSVNEFIIRNRLGPHLSTRTAECSIVAAAYGVDYRWPLLDRRLVQQYLSTPTVWKYAEGQGRYLHRRAISGIIPDKVAWKAGKDMGRADRNFATPETKLPEIDPTDLPGLLQGLIDTERLARLQADPGPGSVFARVKLARLAGLCAWLDR